MTVTAAAIADRAERDRAVDVALPERAEVLEAVLVDDLGRERVEPPERGHEQHGERAQVGDHEPADRRREQQPELRRGRR